MAKQYYRVVEADSDKVAELLDKATSDTIATLLSKGLIESLGNVDALEAGKIAKVDPLGEKIFWADPETAASAAWGGLTGDIENQTDLTEYVQKTRDENGTVRAQALTNGFLIGESADRGSVELYRRVSVASEGNAVDLELGDGTTDGFYDFEITAGVRGLNMYRAIGFARIDISTSSLLTSDLKVLYAGLTSYTGYQINISEPFYEDGKAKVRIALVSGGSTFAVRAKVSTSFANSSTSV